MDNDEDIMALSHPESNGKLMHFVKKRIPIVNWLPKYNRMTAMADLVAGITLGLTLVPQSIAYASLAGLQVHYGLYSAFMGTIIYTVFGTVKEASIGPTSLMALLTLQTCKGLPIEYVVLLTLLSGCVVFAMGLLRLGFLVNLISQPVTSGFTSGSVIIIVTAQIKGLIGLKYTAKNVIEVIKLLAANIQHIKPADCILSAVCISFIMALRMVKDIKVNPKRYKLKKALFLISISRNALAVLLSGAFAYCTTYDQCNPLVTLSGCVEPGLPHLDLPSVSVVRNNSTVYFPDMVKQLGMSVLMVPIVMVLANVAIAKAFSSGRPFDATQEMLTLGLCNIFGSFVHSMPTCGAFTRSAVSHSSGVRTPFAGIYSAAISLLALAFMTHYFYFIPKATLSSVLVCAIVFMFDFKIFVRLWRQSKPDFIVIFSTFLVTVFWTLEMAVMTGIIANVAVVIVSVARPSFDITIVKVPGIGECARVVPTLALVYLNIDNFTSKVARAAKSVTLIDCSQLQLLDFCAEQSLEQLTKKLKSNSQKLIFYNASLEIMSRLENVDWVDYRQLQARTESDAVFANIDNALSIPTNEDESNSPLLQSNLENLEKTEEEK